MVGLSVILENYKDLNAKRSPQVINKGSMIKPPYSNLSSPTSPSSFNVFSSRNNYNNNNNNNSNNNVSLSNISSICGGFLEICFLCKQKLMPGKDIYMYKGDRAFCSEECRCRQIFMDEEETSTTAAKSGCTREYNCSLDAPSSSSRRNKGTRSNRANNAFAY